jgi:septal ring factor EnvC (AmiA/AmiB activator)
MEMEEEILSCKSELREIRTKLKKSKDDLEKCEEKIEEFSLNLKKTKKKHDKKLGNLENDLKYLENSVDWEEFEIVNQEVKVKKEGFQEIFDKSEQITRDLQFNSREVGSIQEDLVDFTDQLNELTSKNKKRVPYTTIRLLCCEICKNLIKKQFSEVILKGFAGHNSVVASILHKDSEKSVRNSLDGKNKRSEKEVCNCLIV